MNNIQNRQTQSCGPHQHNTPETADRNKIGLTPPTRTKVEQEEQTNRETATDMSMLKQTQQYPVDPTWKRMTTANTYNTHYRLTKHDPAAYFCHKWFGLVYILLREGQPVCMYTNRNLHKYTSCETTESGLDQPDTCTAGNCALHITNHTKTLGQDCHPPPISHHHHSHSQHFSLTWKPCTLPTYTTHHSSTALALHKTVTTERLQQTERLTARLVRY